MKFVRLVFLVVACLALVAFVVVSLITEVDEIAVDPNAPVAQGEPLGRDVGSERQSVPESSSGERGGAATTTKEDEKVDVAAGRTESGEIVVRVLWGERPVHGAVVRLDVAEWNSEDRIQSTTDASGCVSLQVPELGAYSGVVKLLSGETRRFTVRANPSRTLFSVVFGAGVLFGTVADESGVAAGGASVAVHRRAGVDGVSYSTVVESESDGSYEVVGLDAGIMDVHVELAGVKSYQAKIALAIDERRRLDFPRAMRKRRLYGDVLSVSGRRVPFAVNLQWSCRDDGSEGRFVSSQDGSFDVELAEGSYALATYAAGRKTELVEMVDLRGGDIKLSLILPGVSLGGVIRYVGSRQRGYPLTKVSLSLTDGGKLDFLLRTDVDAGYCFLGLPPAEYAITVHPYRLMGAPSGALNVDLRQSEDVVLLDLDIDTP